MIYYVHDTEKDLIKIGYSINIPGRFCMLRLQVGQGFRVLGFHGGSRKFERWLHMHYAAHWGHGEWFRPNPDLWHRIGSARRALELEGIYLGEPAQPNVHPNTLAAIRRKKNRD